MKFFITPFFFLLFSTCIYAQHVKGNLKSHYGQDIKLYGYDGFKTILIAKSTINNEGNFLLDYGKYAPYKGMAYIETIDKSKLFIVLNEPDIHLTGSHLKKLDSIKFQNSSENIIFTKYSIEHNQRENALAGWKHILPMYQTNPLFTEQKKELTIIQKEIKRIEKEDVDFLTNLNTTSYVSWFLPLRKLLDDIPLSAKFYTSRIPSHLSIFRKLDFNNPYIITSGILDDLIETHYWLIENSGMSIDSMYAQMNQSTDSLLKNLSINEYLFNEVITHLFSFLEKRSLFEASEYLALKTLTQKKCHLNTELSKQLESYRKMKVGNIAPDIPFNIDKTHLNITKLSDLKEKYTLIVFGSSWCQLCREEVTKLSNYYNKWKLKGLETVFISLDTDKDEYSMFVKDLPFLSSCDFKGWKTKAALDYFVNSTPTLFLLNSNREILLRPVSTKQVDAWFNYKIQ